MMLIPKKSGRNHLMVWFLLLLFSGGEGMAQAKSGGKYQLQIDYVDKDSAFIPPALQLQTTFLNQAQCAGYVSQLPALLQQKGFPAASVDSIRYDSSIAHLQLYLGKAQQFIQLHIPQPELKAFVPARRASGLKESNLLTTVQLQALKEKALAYYENTGYPFATVTLDSILFQPSSVTATLSVNKGPLYHIDSLRQKGTAKIANNFLQRHLQITNGSLYNKQRLQEVGERLLELPYLQETQPAELLMLGTGSILDLYLQPKKSSQVNFLVGFLPANTQTNKLQLTGDVNLQLRNALGSGETILFNWQQLQLGSPRINLGYQHPYILKSAFGVDFAFDLFKKDSSFLQLNAQLGVQYLLSSRQSGKLFVQRQRSFLLGSGVDTNLVKRTRQLPVNIDVGAVNVGVDYDLNTTNYRFNPSRGTEFKLLATIGVKTITPNNEILNLTDPGFDFADLYDSLQLRTYQFRARGTAAHYFPLGKRSAIKTVVNAGIFNSPNIFRNELFQIGGYKLLRGFDEESIYATRYGVVTLEYRNLVAQNSYLFSFVDLGWASNRYQQVNIANRFTSGGLGMVFETRAGVLNMSFAVGKRNDLSFDLRQAAKIHFGYINYF